LNKYNSTNTNSQQQDRTPGKTYDRVIIFLIVIKGLEVGWGFFYNYLDGRWLNYSLRAPEKKRYETRQQAKQVEGDLPGFRVSKVVTYTVGVQLSCLIVAAWAVSCDSSEMKVLERMQLTLQLYITFSLGT
jgi:hypothetical protein